jgi:hypothetical protein
MVDAIGSLEQIVKDKDLSVTVQEREQPAPVVNIDSPDLEPIRKEITNVAKCVKGIVIPEYKTDNAEVEKLLKKSNRLLSDLLDKPTGGGGGGGSSWVAVNEAGTPIPMSLNDGSLSVATTPFAINANVNTEIVTAGTIKTITQTDGVRTCTTTIDTTDPLDKLITKVWS